MIPKRPTNAAPSLVRIGLVEPVGNALLIKNGATYAGLAPSAGVPSAKSYAFPPAA